MKFLAYNVIRIVLHSSLGYLLARPLKSTKSDAVGTGTSDIGRFAEKVKCLDFYIPLLTGIT